MIYRFGPYALDSEGYELTRDGEPVAVALVKERFPGAEIVPELYYDGLRKAGWEG